MKNKAIKRLILLILPMIFLVGCNKDEIHLSYRNYEADCGKEVLKYLKYNKEYDLGCSIEKDNFYYDIHIFKYIDTNKNANYKEVFINNASSDFVKKYFGEDFNKVNED